MRPYNADLVAPLLGNRRAMATTLCPLIDGLSLCQPPSTKLMRPSPHNRVMAHFTYTLYVGFEPLEIIMSQSEYDDECLNIRELINK